MQLSMTVLRCPDRVTPEARTVSGGEFHVGRGPDVDWVLPDPDRLLSKRHFAVAFRGGSWQVADTSTNGTYLNTEADSIGRGAARSLRDGDRLRLGAYEIEIRLVDQPAQGMAHGMAQGVSGGMAGQSSFGDPFDDDPLAPTPPPRRPFNEPEYPSLGMAPPSAQLPHDFDPLAPEHHEPAFGGFGGAAQSDHSSSMEDAMIAPPIAGYVSPHAGGIIPADELIPDDFDKYLMDDIAPPRSPVAAPAHPEPMPVPVPPRLEPVDFLDPMAPEADVRAPPAATPIAVPAAVAAPVVRQLTPRPATPPPAAPDIDPFNDEGGEPPIPVRPAPPNSTGDAPVGSPFPVMSPFDEPSDQIAPAPVASPAPAARPAAAPARTADDGGALAAFFNGAELSGATPDDPVAMMTGLGQAFRAVVAGLRAVLIARATIKSEFRIEQTMIRARGNNPLKFSANDDDALTALLGVGRRTDMTPAAAIEDSLRDLRLHEVAVMAAMQVAVRAMLDELSPDKIRAGTDQSGMTVLPAQRKARAWDVFEARHASVVQALVDDFDSIFGKSFARAYERALDEISTRERQ